MNRSILNDVIIIQRQHERFSKRIQVIDQAGHQDIGGKRLRRFQQGASQFTKICNNRLECGNYIGNKAIRIIVIGVKRKKGNRVFGAMRPIAE